MTPRYISREQAKLAVESAGLDTSRPIDEQLGEARNVEQQVAQLSARVDELAAALRPSEPDEPPTPERALADRLNAAQSTWYSGGSDAA